ncbi:hypothetical protein [Nitrosophilus labii]|uniref:hypothetical protein n=1 Tax=Nitrosophilus labii TaxID=2706014 RepID=UPI0016569330|nr:hypothetical protein [Nitrosophilus labii]
MRIENLVYLIGGELKSSPCVSEIKGFSFDSNSIKRGELFFAKNKKDINQAVQNGAYAVLFEGWTQITDSEIAWIKVENIEIAALKLLRFFLIQKSIPIFKLSSVEYNIAKELSNDKDILFIKKDFIKALIDFFKKDVKLILISDTDSLKRLSLDYNTPKISKKVNIIKTYIFETSFIYDNIFYERVYISPIFIEEFNRVLNLLEERFVEFNLKNIEKLDHFKPYFIDNRFSLKEFGKSDKVIIIENDYTLLEKERSFLESDAKWAKKIYISDKKTKGFIFEKRFDKIKEILYNEHFNFALIAKKDLKLEDLEIKKTYKSLF